MSSASGGSSPQEARIPALLAVGVVAVVVVEVVMVLMEVVVLSSDIINFS